MRYGKKYAEEKHKAVKHANRPKRPLEIVEIDHTLLDLFVVDDETGMPIGRPTFSVAEDKASAEITGFYLSFHPPSYLSVMNCLLHAIQPKDYIRTLYPDIKNDWDAYGVMETVRCDNGAEFHSADFEDAGRQLGFVIQYCPPRKPWYKGGVERSLKTKNTELIHLQPGTTFSNIFDLKDYDPKKNAVITLSTLLEIIHVYIVDIYHQKVHRGVMRFPRNAGKNLRIITLRLCR
jgi:putative transposase